MSNPWEPAAPNPQPAVPAGWYPDPAGSGGQRWWDGTQWSEHVAPPAAPVAPAVAEPVAPVQPAAVEPVAPAADPYAPAATDPYAPAAAASPDVPAAPAAPVAPPAPAVPAPAVPAPAAYAAAAPAAYGSVAGYGAAPSYNQYVQPRSVGFGEAVRRAFSGWKDYSSRATLSEFWWFFLFQVIVQVVLSVLFFIFVFGALFTASSTTASDGQIDSTAGAGISIVAILIMLVVFAIGIVLFLVSLALTVRRLHDTDKSGWLAVLYVTGLTTIILLVLCAMAGTPGPNQYGPVPQ